MYVAREPLIIDPKSALPARTPVVPIYSAASLAALASKLFQVKGLKLD